MAIPHGDHVDLGYNELRNALMHPLAADPAWAAGHGGQVWYRSDLNRISWFDTAGSVHRVRLDALITNSDIAANAAIALSKLATGDLDLGSGGALKFGNTGRIKSAGSGVLAVRNDADNADGRLRVSLPIDASDAANKSYVDSFVQGIHWLSARAASTGNVALSGFGGTIDGIALTANQFALLKNQTNPAQNGVYRFDGLGNFARIDNMNDASEIDGRVVIVEDGDTQAGTLWVTTSEVASLGTDPIVFTQFNAAADILAGKALSRTGNTIDVNPGQGLEWENISDTLQLMVEQDGGIGFNGSGEVYVTADRAKLRAPVYLVRTSNTNVAAPGNLAAMGVILGGRVLLANQTAPSENGVWIYNGGASAMTRVASEQTTSTMFGAEVICLNLNNLFHKTRWTQKNSSGDQSWTMVGTVHAEQQDTVANPGDYSFVVATLLPGEPVVHAVNTWRLTTAGAVTTRERYAVGTKWAYDSSNGTLTVVASVGSTPPAPFELVTDVSFGLS